MPNNTYHTGTGSNLEQKRTYVCKQEIIVTETNIFWSANKL